MERYTCWTLGPLLMMLLFLQIQSSSEYNRHTLEAPHDVQIRDLGYLGLLLVTWRPPESIKLLANTCRVRFHLTYFNPFHNWWSVIRTPGTSRRVQFDLSKEVRVRVHTLLTGPACTNGTEVQSTRYAELRLGCVFHRMEFTECTWEHANQTPPTSLHSLYYWYGELGMTRECPKYIMHNSTRQGCNFTLDQLPDFSHVSICVNSSSPSGVSTPAYLYFNIQNHVKPAATEELQIEVVTGPEPQLELAWGHPCGRVPAHCLQWEVERSPHGPNGSQPTEKCTVTMETSLREPLVSEVERACFRVRCKLVDYCAE
ncbi:hypothetical protein CRUP_016555, partial [Coryphaenoides rupestris]